MLLIRPWVYIMVYCRENYSKQTCFFVIVFIELPSFYVYTRQLNLYSSHWMYPVQERFYSHVTRWVATCASGNVNKADNTVQSSYRTSIRLKRATAVTLQNRNAAIKSDIPMLHGPNRFWLIYAQITCPRCQNFGSPVTFLNILITEQELLLPKVFRNIFIKINILLWEWTYVLWREKRLSSKEVYR